MTQFSEKIFVKQILSSVSEVIGSKKVGLHEPYLGSNDKRNLLKCIDSNYVSYLGEFVTNFEKKISEYTGAKYVVTTNSGTSALHLACRLLEINAESEVLLPAMSFVAPANAVKYLNGTPHFVDIDNQTLGIDPEKLSRYLKKITKNINGKSINVNTKKIIKAIIVVHAYGHPVKINEIIKVAKQYNIKVIEDAAESLGSFYKKRHTGTLGDIGILSFNGNKIVTTGGGGAVLLNKKRIYDIAKHLSTTAKIDHRWDLIHDDIGYNFRMPNVNAALGCSQIDQIKKLLKYKRKLAQEYYRSLKSINGISFFNEPKNTFSNYWLNTIILDKNKRHLRDKILNILHKNGFQARPSWKPLDTLKMYNRCPSDKLITTHDISSRVINLPSGYNIL